MVGLSRASPVRALAANSLHGCNEAGCDQRCGASGLCHGCGSLRRSGLINQDQLIATHCKAAKRLQEIHAEQAARQEAFLRHRWREHYGARISPICKVAMVIDGACLAIRCHDRH